MNQNISEKFRKKQVKKASFCKKSVALSSTIAHFSLLAETLDQPKLDKF